MALKVHNRIYGKAVGLTVNGVDYWADTVGWELAAEKSDKNELTFADYSAGATAKRKLKVKAIQSTDPTSFCQLVEGNVGKTLTITLAPHGNKTASETQPHFKVICKVDLPPTLSSEAGDEKGSTFEVEWEVITYEKKTSGSTLGTNNMTDSLAG